MRPEIDFVKVEDSIVSLIKLLALNVAGVLEVLAVNLLLTNRRRGELSGDLVSKVLIL